MPISKRRQDLKEALLEAAEQAIAAGGLTALRARDLAAQVGCAVGGIYNVFADLDELAMSVNARTLRVLEAHLQPAGAAPVTLSPAAAIDQLVQLAHGYLDFAAAHTPRWRAVFEHRLPPGKEVPAWYIDEQTRVFGHVEAPLRALLPSFADGERALMARSLFSAVHGVVALGLEEKLQALPLPTLREQLALLVSVIGRGLVSQANASR